MPSTLRWHDRYQKTRIPQRVQRHPNPKRRGRVLRRCIFDRSKAFDGDGLRTGYQVLEGQHGYGFSRWLAVQLRFAVLGYRHRCRSENRNEKENG